jgi:DNA-binding CsgD family transcriptional regulator
VASRRGQSADASIGVIQMTTDPYPRGRAAELKGRRRERDRLDRLLAAVQAGGSRALVVCGEPGVGKTALLDYVAAQAEGYRVARATGIQSEMELVFAGLYQLCSPMLDHLDCLPVPQREALRTAFAISAGPAPDRFLVGLAVLSLLSEVAEERPLICLVDDEQWLDRASAQALGFAARRLAAEPVGLVFAARELDGELAGLPELAVGGLQEDDAQTLLDALLTGPLDARVRDQIVAETRGNPLALLELVRGVTPAELAGGFGLLSGAPLSGRVEEAFRQRVDALPAQTRRLVLVAAADPTGDPGLVWGAARSLGIGTEAATPAAGAGLVDFGARVRFRHPLVRSAAYRSASLQDRQDVHRALAEATDPQADPDRRAWHRAQAAPGPDEDVAGELERSACRAQGRGGLAAAAAFLERSAILTPEPARRAKRLLAAARSKSDVGALDAALGLLIAVEAGPSDALRSAEVEHLRGQIALVQRRGRDAARLLLSAASRLEPLDADLARQTRLEAIEAAIWAGDLDRPGGVREAAGPARTAAPRPEAPRAVDVLFDAFALRLTNGYSAAAPALTHALELVLAQEVATDEAGRWLILERVLIGLELWDAESSHALAARETQFARDAGAPLFLRLAINLLARSHILAGELTTAALLIDEDRLIGEICRNPPIAYTEMMLTAWRGQEAQTAELIAATVQEATAAGLGRIVDFADYASAVLHNSLGRHDAARDAARRAFEHDPLGYGPLVVPELAEAASRTGDMTLGRIALEWLTERARLSPTEWVLGIEARARALLSHGNAAERCYRESIAHLSQTRVRAELARGHLLYGEWLRRERRRAGAREELRTACAMLDAMGMDAFADRARRELAATGETARKRNVESTSQLTAQEAQVARLARDGLSNPQIGARLFLSTRTVQYHLSNVFAKLGITSRSHLDRVMPADPTTAPTH